MANYKTHISTSTTLGVIYAVGGHYAFGFQIPECIVAGALCSVAGMLPDLDSDSGIPQREMLSFVSAVVPVMMLPRFQRMGLEPDQIVFATFVIYGLIRFGVGYLFKRFTRHRGMWHSIPAALIAGLVTYLVSLSPEFSVRVFKSWAVVLGFISHLVLDEIYAVDWNGRTIRVKKSFGTALKWFSPRLYPNISVYSKLILLIILAMGDDKLMEYFGREPIDIPFTARDWVIDQLNQGNPIILR